MSAVVDRPRNLLDPGLCLTLRPMAYRLRGPWSPALLAAGFEEVVRRHESLRTTFAAVPADAATPKDTVVIAWQLDGIIAFDPGEPHDLLLSAAWAETENVPARRQRRFPLDVNIGIRSPSGTEGSGRLVNLSFGGCCLRVTKTETELKLGVVTRPMGGYGLPTCLRITIGTPAENRRCLAALEHVLGELRQARS